MYAPGVPNQETRPGHVRLAPMAKQSQHHNPNALFASSMKYRSATTPEEQQLIEKHFPKNIRFNNLWHAVDLNYYDVSHINPAIWHIFKVTANQKYIDLKQKAWIGSCLVPKLPEGVYRGDLPAIVPRLREQAVHPDRPAPRSDIPKPYKSTINDFIHARHAMPSSRSPHHHDHRPSMHNNNNNNRQDHAAWPSPADRANTDLGWQSTAGHPSSNPRHDDRSGVVASPHVAHHGYADEHRGAPSRFQTYGYSHPYGRPGRDHVDDRRHHDLNDSVYGDSRDDDDPPRYARSTRPTRAEDDDDALEHDEEDGQALDDQEDDDDDQDDELDAARMVRFQKMSAINRDKLLSDYEQTIKHCKIKGVTPRIVIKNIDDATCQQLITAINENQIGYSKDKWLKTCRMVARTAGVGLYKANEALKLMPLSAAGVAPEISEREFLKRWESTVDYNEPEFEELFHIVRGKGNPVPEPNPLRDIALSFASVVGTEFMSNTIGIKYQDLIKVPFETEKDPQEAYREPPAAAAPTASHPNPSNPGVKSLPDTKASSGQPQHRQPSQAPPNVPTKPAPSKTASPATQGASHAPRTTPAVLVEKPNLPTAAHTVPPKPQSTSHATNDASHPPKTASEARPTTMASQAPVTRHAPSNDATEPVTLPNQTHASPSTDPTTDTPTAKTTAPLAGVANTTRPKKKRILGSFTLPDDIDV